MVKKIEAQKDNLGPDEHQALNMYYGYLREAWLCGEYVVLVESKDAFEARLRKNRDELIEVLQMMSQWHCQRACAWIVEAVCAEDDNAYMIEAAIASWRCIYGVQSLAIDDVNYNKG